jgi:hypothetical protein
MHAPLLPEIPLLNDTVAVRARGAIRTEPATATCLAAGPFGGVTLRDRELRAFCQRLIGWSEARASLVDVAVDGVLSAIACGTPIALRGSSDLVPVAYALHRRIFGAERPFIVCDRRRREGDGSVRTPPSRPTCALALEAAMDGSLCLRSERLPEDFDWLCRSLAEGACAATVFVCLHGDDRLRDLLCRPLEVPPLSSRAPESDRLLQESLDEAVAELGAESLRIPRQLRQKILDSIPSFAELEKTALRVAALASTTNISQAAARLGMAPVSLRRWLDRRPWLEPVLSGLNRNLSQADD